ncbi:MAG: metallophosphoesterase [Phycisphaerae bacterium]
MDEPLYKGRKQDESEDTRFFGTYMDYEKLDEDDFSDSDSLISRPSKKDSPVSVEARGTQSKATLNKDICVYMNVGAWTGGQSTFGLVSGPEVALCCLHPGKPPVPPRHGGQIRIPKQEPGFDLLDPKGRIATFLTGAAQYHHAPRTPQVLAYYRCPYDFELISKDSLYLFFPDMHINLYKGLPCDAFIKRDGSNQKVSQAPDLAAMLKYVEWCLSNPFLETKVFHLGDLYEVCHTQAILNRAYHQYAKELKKGSTPNPANFRGVTTAYGAIELWSRRKSMKWKVPWKQDDPIRVYLSKCKLDILDRTGIESAIEGLYAADGMTPQLWNILKQNFIRGNHDMAPPHPYLVDVFQNSISETDAMKKAVEDGKKQKWVVCDDPQIQNPVYGGGTQYVHWEHGHAYDPSNNIQTFFRMDVRSRNVFKTKFIEDFGLPGGWLSTQEYLIDAFNAEAKGQAAKDPGLWASANRKVTKKVTKKAKDYLGDSVLETYALWRAFRIFDQMPDVKLVVMGHTHVPHLEDFSETKNQKQSEAYSMLEELDM